MGFGEHIRWGAGITAVAAHGAAPRSDLRHWLDARPATAGAARAGAGTDPHDLALLADLGMRQVRLTLDWARLEPEPGHRDAPALERARGALSAAIDAGLEPWGCLHDGPLPGWFSVDEHGFADRKARQYFWARHVDFVGEAFGDLVHGWVPTFEPTRWAWRGWMDGTRPPGLHGDAERCAEQLEAVLLAGTDAALRLRQDGHPVATAHQITPVFAARTSPEVPPSAEAEVAAAALDATLNRSWLTAFDEDELQVPGRPPVPAARTREAFDLIGITYRHGVAVHGDGQVVPYPHRRALGPDGHVSWPEGLRLAIEQVAELVPDLPLLVAGIGITTGHEPEAEQYLREALAHLEAAATGGIDLRAIWWETPVDPTPGPVGGGLFDHARTLRASGSLLQAVIAGGTVPS